MKRKLFTYYLGILIALAWAGVVGCGGGSTGAGGTSVTVTGKVVSAQGSANQNLAMAMHAADHPDLAGITVVATDEDGNTVTSTTEATGSFSIDLAPGHTYVISFFFDQSFLGVLVFNLNINGEFTTTAFRLNPGDGAIGLGNIACATGVCVGDLNPLCQLDRDDDGDVDCEDADDDNDGIEDEDEADDDHDGISDDDEGEDDDDGVAGCEVIRVEPFDGAMGVDLNDEIKVRYSAMLNEATVDSNSVELSTSDGQAVPMTIQIENEPEHGEIRIEPLSDLLPLTSYTLHLAATIQCSDGTSPAADLTIHFTTGEDHSGEGGDDSSGEN